MRSLPALPREIEMDPQHEQIRARFASPDRALWARGNVAVPVLALAPRVGAALAAAYAAGHLVLDLERIATALATEARGLSLVSARSGSKPSARVSRLLLLSDHGAERFYRHVEGLIVTHTPRVLAAILMADATTVGRAIMARDARVKAVLVQRTQVAATLMRALVG